MRPLLILFLVLFSSILQAQQEISGRVTDKSNNPIAGANVYLQGTYDGATTDQQGNFFFTTLAGKKQTLVVSFLSFETIHKQMDVSLMKNIQVSLREDVTGLDAVIVSAGTFSAGDNSRVTVLKPLDVVTTAGVAGDFIAALQTLPGTSPVGEDGRLFVRGGTAGETKVFIDGLQVFQPYSASANNLPSRGRFSPFLFDGITFSSGGYSAEYGQALSAVLLLNTIDEPQQTETNISLMSVGGGIGHTQKWNKASLSLSSSYTNLAPYQELVPNNEQANFPKPYENLGGEAVFRRHFKNGLFKWYAAYDHTNLEVLQLNLDSPDLLEVGLNNRNFYSNISYQGVLGNSWSVYPGLSAAFSNNHLQINNLHVNTREVAANLKLKLTKRFHNRFKVHIGSEYVFRNFSEEVLTPENPAHTYEVQPDNFAAFTEADLNLSKNFAFKGGVRGDYMLLQEKVMFSPRISMALKSGKDGQISLAYGEFLQQAEIEQLKFDKSLQPEKATHYILNYQLTRPGSVFRAEAFHKEYGDLVKYDTPQPGFDGSYDNLGEGYARGLDLFYRDDESISNLQYWISYSFIDSKREYMNYPEEVTPQFIADHSASLVTKYWVSALRSQLGFTYNFASGRPFEDPNKSGFMNGKTRNYNSLSFNWAFLLSPQKILYFSASNILGYKNVFNYEYASTLNATGQYDRKAITPAADRFFFIGFFWTISKDKAKNQLDSL
ncbi:MAG: TonB-dependent receptor [Salinimicrobium sediminis]|nr:TonB-dependent receptor [Salinimicrobium sediminis]